MHEFVVTLVDYLAQHVDGYGEIQSRQGAFPKQINDPLVLIAIISCHIRGY